MFNKNFKRIRLTKGLSQKQVADYLNISPQSISKWEKGEALPSIDFLPKLAEIFDSEINDFFAVIPENTDDIRSIKEIFAFMVEYICEETKSFGDFMAFIELHPNTLDIVSCVGDKFKKHQVIKGKAIQGILGCSEEEGAEFTRTFIKLELIEKIETEDAYFVIKNSFEELVKIVEIAMETRVYIEKLEKEKAGA